MKNKVIGASILFLILSACHGSPPPEKVTTFFAQSDKKVPSWMNKKISLFDRTHGIDIESTEQTTHFQKMQYSIVWAPYDGLRNWVLHGEAGRHGTLKASFVKEVPESTWVSLRDQGRRLACSQARGMVRYYANNTLHIRHPKFIQRTFYREYVTTFGKGKIVSGTVAESCYVTLKKEVVNACQKNTGANKKTKNCVTGSGAKSAGMGASQAKTSGLKT